MGTVLLCVYSPVEAFFWGGCGLHLADVLVSIGGVAMGHACGGGFHACGGLLARSSFMPSFALHAICHNSFICNHSYYNSRLTFAGLRGGGLRGKVFLLCAQSFCLTTAQVSYARTVKRGELVQSFFTKGC